MRRSSRGRGLRKVKSSRRASDTAGVEEDVLEFGVRQLRFGFMRQSATKSDEEAGFVYM